jgi:hypothetical protein
VQCSELSATTYFLVVITSLVSVYACYGFCASARHAIKFYDGNPRIMLRSSGGRTLVFSNLLHICTFTYSLGLSLHALRVDRDVIFIRFIIQPSNGLIVASFSGATLSVSTIWLQSVEKARVLAPGGKLKMLYLHPGLAVSSISCIGIAAVALAWIYLRSNSMFPIVGALMQMILSVSFRVAGQRVKSLLKLTLLANCNSRIDGVEIPSSAVQKTQAIAEKIQRTASFMSWSLAVLCILFLFSAFTLPAQKPLYSAQNKLPRILSGQIACGLVSLNNVFFV